MNKQTEALKNDYYSFQRPIKGICKSYGIWAHKGCTINPLIYFHKPKNITETQWEFIMSKIDFGNLPLELPNE